MSEPLGLLPGIEPTPSEGYNPLSAHLRETAMANAPVDSNPLATMADVFSYGIQATVVNAVDVLASSVVPDSVLTPGHVNSIVETQFPDYGRFAQENRGGVQLASELLTAFLPITLAVKAVRGVQTARKVLKIPEGQAHWIDALFSTGASNRKLAAAFRAEKTELGKLGVTDVTATTKALKSKAFQTMGFDLVKESIAVEAAMYATMNESQIVYPDALSIKDYAVLGVGATGIVGAIQGMALAYGMRAASANGAKQAAAYWKEFAGVEANTVGGYSMPGNRGGTLATLSDAKIALNDVQYSTVNQPIGTSALGSERNAAQRDVANSSAAAIDNRINETVSAMFEDKTAPWTSQHRFKDYSTAKPYVETVKLAMDNNSRNFVGVTSLELMSKNVPARLTAERTSIQNQLDEAMVTKRAEEVEFGAPKNETTKLISELQAKQEVAAKSNVSILAANGEWLPSGSLWGDMQFIETPITRKRFAADIGPAGASYNYIEQSKTLSKHAGFGVSANEQGVVTFSLATIAGGKGRYIDGKNVTEILPSSKLDEIKANAAKGYEEFKRELTLEYHPHGAEVGRPTNKGSIIRSGLSKDAKNIQDFWKDSPRKSGLREHVAANSEAYQELYKAWTPWRNELAGIADHNGTVTLYRGEQQAEIKSWKSKPEDINDIVSMTSNIETAKAFAGSKGQVIARRVPIDDFVMPSGLGNEYEFVVKNNKARVEATHTTAAGEITVDDVIITTDNFIARNITETKHAYAVLSRAASEHIPATKLYASPNDHFTKLDFIQEVAVNHGGNADIRYVNGFNNLRDVEFASYMQKFDSYSARMDMRKVYLEGKIKLGKQSVFEENDIARTLNLPTVSTGEAHPAVKLFNTLYAQGTHPTQIFRNMDELQTALKLDKYVPEKFAQIYDASEPLALRGKMIADTGERKPVMVVGMDTPAADYTTLRIQEKSEIEFNNALNILRGTADVETPKAPLTKLIMNILDGDPARIEAARQVESLSTAAMRNNPIMSQEMVAGENIALMTMRQLEQIIDRQARPWIAQQLQQHQAIINNILKPGNKAILTEVNLYRHARAQRWDVLKSPVAEEGKFGLKLAETDTNKQLWAETYGGEMPKDAIMPMPSMGNDVYKPFWLSKDAFEWARAETRMRDIELSHMNVLRQAEGKGPITRREWTVHPVNFANKEVAYLVDLSSGEMKGMFPAATAHQAKTAAEKARAAEAASGANGYVVKMQSELKTEHQFEDELFGNLKNYAILGKQTGEKATGKSVTDLAIRVGDQGVLEANKAFVANMESIIRRTRAAYFAPQMNYARAMEHADNSMTALSGKRLSEQGGTAGQHYIDAVYGRQTLNKGDVPGKFMMPLDSMLDDVIKGIAAKYESITVAAKSLTKQQLAKQQEYIDLVDHLGVEYNPFRDVNQFMERTQQVKVPPSIRSVQGKLANYTVAIMLRVLNPSHGILNMASLGATLPATIKGLARGADEAEDLWRSRTAAHSTSIDGKTMQLDVVKSLTTTWHDWFNNPEFKSAMEEAGNLHYFDQEVAESLRTLTAPLEGWHEGIINRGVNKLSVISDQTEKMSRAVSFGVGYTIARDVMRMEGNAARFGFAHEFANKNIGNYAASNKPKIFQGATGMSLGLFQTFAWNYYQRLFSYIERGDKRAIAVQYAMQASLFGAESVPGWDVFTENFAKNYNGSVNVIDGIRNQMGDGPLAIAAVDTFMYGSLSTLSGMSMSTRGDMNPRHLPNILQLGDLPQVRLMQNTSEIVSRTFKMAASEAGWNAEQQAEILGQFASMRSMQGLAQLYTGEETDRRARLIEADTRTTLGVIARMLTLRPLKSAAMTDTLYRSDRIDAVERDKMQTLNSQASAIVRGGGTDEEIGTKLEAVAKDYMRYSGNPESVGTWLFNRAKRAVTERESEVLLRIARDPNQLSIVKRLIELQAKPEEE